MLADARPALQVSAENFWRPAGERFEYGREDPEAFRLQWLDAGALRREVLVASDTEPATYLPALYDPKLDRSARRQRGAVPARAVLLVHGSFLLGRDLPADLTVHLPFVVGCADPAGRAAVAVGRLRGLRPGGPAG